MNTWVIAAIFVGLLAITAVIVTNVNSVKAETPVKVGCSSCGGQCTADKNCGLGTCGAVNGAGTCGCGKSK